MSTMFVWWDGGGVCVCVCVRRGGRGGGVRESKNIYLYVKSVVLTAPHTSLMLKEPMCQALMAVCRHYYRSFK